MVRGESAPAISGQYPPGERERGGEEGMTRQRVLAHGWVPNCGCGCGWHLPQRTSPGIGKIPPTYPAF